MSEQPVTRQKEQAEFVAVFDGVDNGDVVEEQMEVTPPPVTGTSW